MADPFSVVASIVGIAGAGIQLSTTLYTYAETAFYADKSLQDIARDVSLTSSVLGQLGELLKQDKQAKLCSEIALKTADEAVTGCRAVFTEIDTALQKSLKKTGDGKSAVSKLQRLKWPCTLLLMLNVLAYAKKLKEEDPLAEEQRICIQRLIQVNQESTARLKQLEKFLSQQSSAAAAPSPDMQTAVLAPPTPPASNSSPVSSLGNTQCLCGRPFQADALHLTERDIAKCLFSINTVQKAIRDVQSLSSSDTSPTEEQVCSKFLKACRTGHDALRLFVESERAHTTKATGIDNAERLRQKAAFHEIGQQLRNTVFECGVDDIKTDAPPQFEKCIKEDSTGGKVPTRSGAVTTCIKWESIRKLAAKARLQTDDSITVPACSPNADWYQGPLRGLEGKAPSEHVQPLNHEHLVKVTCGFEDAEDGKLSAREGDIIRVLEDQGNWWKGSLKGQVGLFLANSTVQVDVQVAPTPKPPPTVPAVLGPNVEGSGRTALQVKVLEIIWRRLRTDTVFCAGAHLVKSLLASRV
ncbi:hypothetical protein H2199_007012 [Coniosporium tulheliwenetii]|uniref:Uncharacterized protein n=1 Tax=Coniosporium tulheliwenetii TaxID=3383036 RepID=A0ACC2YSE8_9PEZI|nr:hypothetical protein H2199_007012 [Cladosporium sp. JES 115]